MDSSSVIAMALASGFELAGVASAEPVPDIERFERWTHAGMAGEMRYLTDHRAEVRADVKRLLPSAKSVICVGKLYNTGPSTNGIARYAQSEDYHLPLKRHIHSLPD